MKKFLTLLLALTLVFAMFALASCNNENDGDDENDGKAGELEELNGKTPEEIYEAASEALVDATKYEVATTQVIKMTMNMGAESQTMEMTQEVVARIDGDKSYVKVSSEGSFGATNMEAWYVDGVVYANNGGQKLKTNITKDQYMQQYMNADPSESTLLDIPKSWFEDITFKAEGDEYKMEFVITGEKYNELLGNLGLDVVLVEGDVEYTVYFDEDGNLTQIVTEFDMGTSIGGSGVDSHCVSTSTVEMKNVTVTAPADADSYQLVDNP